MKQRAAVLACGLFIAGTAGCAYFNTLYHARRFYREAEASRKRTPEGQEPTQANEAYLKAAKKCAKVIAEHADSRWVDDAIVLMGHCFYHRGEFERALKKYEELRTLYPNSNLVDEASFMTGMTLWRMGRAEEARPYLEAERSRPGEREAREEAWRALGRIALEAGDFAGAVETFQALLAGKDLDKTRTETKFWLGESLARAGRADEAMAVLRDAAHESDDPAVFRRFETRLGEILEEEGRHAEAVVLFGELAQRETEPTRRFELEMRRAESLRKAGDLAGAQALLEEVIREAGNTESAAEAQFRIGLIYQNHLRDYAKALEAYDKVRDISPGAKATREAGEERGKILKVQRFQEEIAKLDSTRVVERAGPHFELAEALLLDLDDPEGALEHYLASCDAGPAGEFAPRALLGASWVLARRLDRRGEGTAMLRRIVEEYPESLQADRARALLEGREEMPEPAPEPEAETEAGP